MKIPVFAVTGFLDSGKTTLLNQMLKLPDLQEMKLLLIQFESGEECFDCETGNCDTLNFSKKEIEQNPLQIADQIYNSLLTQPKNLIWVEWNGMTPFSDLQAIFFDPHLRDLCRIEKVIHVADAALLENLLGKTGGALPEQISSCDFAVVRNIRSRSHLIRLKRLVRSLNPGIRLYQFSEMKEIMSDLYREPIHPVNGFCCAIIFLVAVSLFASQIVNLTVTPVNTIVNVFLGVILQAIPFLLIGVLISSAIQVFLSNDAIERRFPKKLGLGMLAAILFGFCLPVCDCTSVPIFKSLIKKGVPVPAAVTFLTAAPVINPIVMLSTYYAFNGSFRIVAIRVGLGIISAVLIGLSFAIWPSREDVIQQGFDVVMCSCGCYYGIEPDAGVKGKLRLFIQHSQAEFFNVGKYLMIGAFLSAIFQMIGTKTFSVQSGAGFALSLFVMMVMAFLLSLCSSSDAVVARSFSSNFSSGSIMGFLVFGPMMDIKNLLMLSGSFSKRFTGKLLVLTFSVCYFVVFLLARFLLGG